MDELDELVARIKAGEFTLAAQAAETPPLFHPISWGEFWGTEPVDPDWLIEPILPRGRQVAIYSPAKAGKSFLALDMAAAIACERPVLGREAVEPVNVVYLDLEMGEDDLRERLEALGYGPEVDMSHLHYYLLPSLPPLDQEDGGGVLADIVDRHQAEAVVIDTMARVVKGEEDEADTYRAFWWWSGRQLKNRGTALLRLDHQGKNPSAGQRGSSAKADDIDVVFRLKVAEDKVTLTRTHSRLSWVPPEVNLTRQEEPLVAHVLADDEYPAGTLEVARSLDELGVPLDERARKAMQALRRTGKGRRTVLVTAALRYRKDRLVPGNGSEPHVSRKPDDF